MRTKSGDDENNALNFNLVGDMKFCFQNRTKGSRKKIEMEKEE